MSDFLPGAEEITAEYFAIPTFIDPGLNWSGVDCPACGADAQAWWGAAVEAAEKAGFSSFMVKASCCGATVSPNELRYVWPAAFGSLVIEAMNPNVNGLEPHQIKELGEALGCSVREIAQHL